MTDSAIFFFFLVLTIAAINKDYLPIKYILAFLIGAICVEIFKFIEIVIRGQSDGFISSFYRRTGGEGKLSIDRAKFFFCISALLSFFLANTISSFNIFGFLLFGLAIASVLVSILSHGAILGIRTKENAGKPLK